MLKVVKGDLFDAKEKYLIHQVNCQGLMGAGECKRSVGLYTNYCMYFGTNNSFNFGYKMY